MTVSVLLFSVNVTSPCVLTISCSTVVNGPCSNNAVVGVTASFFALAFTAFTLRVTTLLLRPSHLTRGCHFEGALPLPTHAALQLPTPQLVQK